MAHFKPHQMENPDEYKVAFKNEKGNKISINVEKCIDDGINCIKVTAEGPHSHTEHVWTEMEALQLLTGISKVHKSVGRQSVKGINNLIFYYASHLFS